MGRKHIEKAEAMEDKEKRKKDKKSSSSDRVTLKKQIGLLSACAIIIGECVTAFVLKCAFMKRRGEVNGETRGWRESCCNVAEAVVNLQCRGTQ